MFTYEQTQTYQYLDPSVSYYTFDDLVEQQVYEGLVQYNGSSQSQVIPWLAQNYTISTDGSAVTWNLRQGIKFSDGEPLNSTAVYFSFNRILVGDGSAPPGHGIESAWIIQQLLDTALSTTLCGCPHVYNATYVNNVLAENFIQITGPYTFTMHIMKPNAALAQILAGSSNWGFIIAPEFVMQHDIGMWNQSSTGYTLTYPVLSGNLTNQIYQYLVDETNTCNAGLTPKGCGTTYLDNSPQGSTAGTGPYILTSVDVSSQTETFNVNPNYWGGGYAKPFHAQIPTVIMKYVPDATTRLIDLENGARSGQALSVDITADHLYDIADRNAWLNNNQLTSIIPGVSIYGPYPSLNTLFDPFDMNVTNPLTGSFYQFQPFADQRIRLAFADSTNVTVIDRQVNNNLGLVAPNVVAPGLGPAGVYNASIAPLYSFNPRAVQDLLLKAMENPVTSFNFENGTSAPPGLFNNTFGCSAADLAANGGTCAHPVIPNPSTINLYVGSADPVDIAIFNQIASVVNNVSVTYNMGIQVAVVPVPTGQLLTQSFSGFYYFYALGWFADYPWVTDFLGPMYAPANVYPGPDGWNLTIMGTLYNRARTDTATNNIPDLIKTSNQMNMIANQAVMYLWTFNTLDIQAVTSNLRGFQFNGAMVSGAGGDALQFFYTLY